MNKALGCLDGDGRPKLLPNSFSSLMLKLPTGTCYSFLMLDNAIYQMNDTFYMLFNFEVPNLYSKKVGWLCRDLIIA